MRDFLSTVAVLCLAAGVANHFLGSSLGDGTTDLFLNIGLISLGFGLLWHGVDRLRRLFR